MFGMFFVGALYLQRVLGLRRLETGLAFLPVTIIMGTLSVRYTEPLVTRFGARGVLLPGLALIGAGLVLFAQAPVDGDYVTDVLPTMVLLGARRGPLLPGADDAGDVGRDAERRRPRLGPGQHDRAGRRRPRARRARDAVGVAHQRAASTAASRRRRR